MSFIDASHMDYQEEYTYETKAMTDFSTDNTCDENSSFSQAPSIKSKATTDWSPDNTCDEKSNYSLALSIADEDDDVLSMKSHFEEKITKELDFARREQKLMWKEEEMQRREEKNKWKEDNIDQWTEEFTHREEEMDRREEVLASREVSVNEQESNLNLLKDELNLGEMTVMEYLHKQESLQDRRHTLKARGGSMKNKNHEAMEKLMKITKSDEVMKNIEDLFHHFYLPVNLNERLSEHVYLNLFSSFFHDLKQSERLLTSLSSLESAADVNSLDTKRALISKYQTFEAKMFFLLTERDVVILNLKRKLLEKDQNLLSKEYAIRHKDIITDERVAIEAQTGAARESKELAQRRGSDMSNATNLTVISEYNDIFKSSTTGSVRGYIKSKQSLERKRVELFQNMENIQKRNDNDLVQRVQFLKDKETTISNKSEHLTSKEIALEQKEEELKEKREILSSLSQSQSSSQISLNYFRGEQSDWKKPLEMENLDKSIKISMLKDEEALEALKSEQFATECAMQELKSETKKKDEEILQTKLLLMKKRVLGTFLSKHHEPNTDADETTAEEKNQKRALMKSLEEESANMKNIIKGLDVSLRALKLDIRKRDDLVRKKNKLGKSWVKVYARSRDANHDLSQSFLHMSHT